MSKEDIIRDVRSKLSEHFEDFLLITKPAKNVILTVLSDETWAKGAAGRFCAIVDEDDRSMQRSLWMKNQ